MTAKLALVFKISIAFIGKSQWRYLHTTHCNKYNENETSTLLQVQMPNDKSRQNSKRQVRNKTENAVKVAKSNDDAHLQAVAIAALVPVVRDWLALQK
jgi:hypothetical protein